MYSSKPFAGTGRLQVGPWNGRVLLLDQDIVYRKCLAAYRHRGCPVGIPVNARRDLVAVGCQARLAEGDGPCGQLVVGVHNGNHPVEGARSLGEHLQELIAELLGIYRKVQLAGIVHRG